MPLSGTGVPSRAGIQAAIDEVAAKIPNTKSGSVNVTHGTAGTTVLVNVTFPTPFATTPSITANPAVVDPLVYSWSITGQSTTGFTLRVHRTNTGTNAFMWIATTAGND